MSTLQVLHQVLAVAGLPRVPEEHDVWSEVQALQVISGVGQRWERAPAPYFQFSKSCHLVLGLRSNHSSKELV